MCHLTYPTTYRRPNPHRLRFMGMDPDESIDVDALKEQYKRVRKTSQGEVVGKQGRSTIRNDRRPAHGPELG